MTPALRWAAIILREEVHTLQLLKRRESGNEA